MTHPNKIITVPGQPGGRKFDQAMAANRRRKTRTVAMRTGMTLRGRVRVQVVENGQVIEDRGFQKNLILNQGLNNLCSGTHLADLFAYCAAGTGTTVTAISSGSGNTGSQTGTTFTNSGAIDFTTQAAVGDMIKMTSGADSGVEVRIVSITNSTTVEVTPSRTTAAGEYDVFYTSQTGLSVESKRTNNYLTGVGNCGATRSGAVYTMKRTYDFTAEVGAVTYEEVGFSNASGSGANLFSRIKLTAGVPLVAGQQLRVIYELDVTVSPTVSTPITASIANWPVAPATTTEGDEICPLLLCSCPDTDGIRDSTLRVVHGVNSDAFSSEPGISTNDRCGIGITATLVAFPSTDSVNQSIGAKGLTLVSYTTNNFFRDKTVTFAVGEANSTSIRSFGVYDISSNRMAHQLVFDEDQTKDSSHTLTLNWRITVGRTLA